MKLHINEFAYDNPKTDIADRIAAWAYLDSNTTIDKICDIEDFIGRELPPKCTYSKAFLSVALQDTLSLNELERIETKFMKSTTNESLTEASQVVKSKTYPTEFGPFVIQTRVGKARRRNWSTGKMEWGEVRSTGGFFQDYPKAIDYWLESDYGDKYVSCSQGDGYRTWVDFLGVNTYDEARGLVDNEVVKCFQDYYGNKSIH